MIFKTLERFRKKFWVKTFECLNLLQIWQIFKRFAGVESFECLNLLQIWQIFKRFMRLESFECLNLLQIWQIFKRFMRLESLECLWNNFYICKRFRHSKDSHWWIFWIFVTFAKDSDIQKIRLKFFPESFKCFEYPANFTIFAKDSDIRKIQLWQIKFFSYSTLVNLWNNFHIYKRFRYSKYSHLRIFWICVTFAKDSDIQKIPTQIFFWIFRMFWISCKLHYFFQKIQIFERFNFLNLWNNFHIFKRFRYSKDLHWQIFWICVTFAKDSDIQKIWLKFFRESFECFEYPANFTIFAKDSDIRKIQLWWIFEIIFTFAKDSDIRKMHQCESF